MPSFKRQLTITAVCLSLPATQAFHHFYAPSIFLPRQSIATFLRSRDFERLGDEASFSNPPADSLAYKRSDESTLFSDTASFKDDVKGVTSSSSDFVTKQPSHDSDVFGETDISIACDVVDCIIIDNDSDRSAMNSESSSLSIIHQFMDSYLGPRVLLAAIACLYGTNFPLGAIMDDALPASAATSARFLLASLVLSPFIFQLRKELIGMSLVAGCFTATGYIAQSLALVDTSPATVSFLGAATVIWCPFLEWLVDKKPMGINERPQTWMAVMLCILGVGILELCGGGIETAQVGIGMGDCLAVLQAIAFGTGLFMSEKMMKQHSDQALPITAVLVATTSLASMVWALVDGWMYNTPGWETMTLPNLLLEPSMREVAIAVIWTGLLSTSLNFFLEVYSLQKVPSGEASVILATEPLWAAAFASIILGESFDWNEYVGGILIVSACLVNCMNASDFQGIIPGVFTDKELKEAAEEIL